MASKTIQKAINPKEKIIKSFSVSTAYIKIKIFFLLFKVLLVFLGLIFIAFITTTGQFISFSENHTESIFPEERIENTRTMADSLRGVSTTNIKEIKNWGSEVWLLLIMVFLLVVIPGVTLFYTFYLKISNEFALTDERIIAKKGWIEISTKTVRYDRITDIKLDQSVLERIIKSGTLSISTAGSDGYEIVLPYAHQPYELKKMIEDARSEQQKKDNPPPSNNENFKTN